MTKAKHLSNKIFCNSFGYFILGKTIPEVQLLCYKVGYLRFMFAATCPLKQQQRKTILKLHNLVKLTLSAICLAKTLSIC